MAINKRFGKKAQSANDALMPWTPTIGTATDVGTNRAYNDGAASVTFTANGPYAATSYTVLASTGQTATGSSSPITVTGIATGATPTFTVKATNANGDSAYSSASSAITITTVPATPSAPSATSPSAGTDTVSWSAPANGGKSITNYYWASSDGKSGNTTATSVNVSQEQGTAQTYTVRADNANGSSATSAASNSITTTFSFAPFSVFSFSPFSVFGFSPFSVFGFSPFGVFGFSPFGFSPFGFSPFGFSPFGFAPYFKGSLSPSTKIVMADGSLVESVDIKVGDVLKSAIIPGLGENFTKEEVMNWVSVNGLDSLEITETTVTTVTEYTAPIFVSVNGDGFSGSHLLLANRDGEIRMRFAEDLLESDLVWSTELNTWTEIVALEKIAYSNNVVGINCEPYDIFFTEKTLTHDGYDEKLN
jgi:hypothetical protein